MSVDWGRLTIDGEPREARSAGEISLYLRIRGAVVLDERRTEEPGRTAVEVAVAHDGTEKRMRFRIPRVDADDPLHLGGASPSRLLDPVDLVLFATRVAQALPDPEMLDGTQLAAWQRDLVLAAEAVNEAVKFIPRKAERVSHDALHTAAARWLYLRDPDRFSRERLVRLEERLLGHVVALQRATERWRTWS